jgi:DNA-binding XRE family transcriptional regulator
VKIETHKGRIIEIWTPNIEEVLKGGRGMQEFNKIKSLRTGAGITQDQMAKALGMSVPTYVNRENGIGDWKLSEMQKFIEVVNNATGSNYNAKDIFF